MVYSFSIFSWLGSCISKHARHARSAQTRSRLSPKRNCFKTADSWRKQFSLHYGRLQLLSSFMQVTLPRPCLHSATVQRSALGLVLPLLSPMKLSLFQARVVHGEDLSGGKKWLLPQLLLSKGDACWQQSPSLGHCSPWWDGYLCQARVHRGFAAPPRTHLTCSFCPQDVFGFQRH